MPEKLVLGVIFGGRSGEHEVSLRSAASILQALDSSKFQIVPIGITREGVWLGNGDPLAALSSGKTPHNCRPVAFLMDPRTPGLLLRGVGEEFIALDMVFPVLHGPFGEDGTIQGMLEMAGVPYVGSGVLGSAAAMDKAVMKSLFRQRGLPVGDYLSFKTFEWLEGPKTVVEKAEEALGYPCFVKPASLGSSVGITKAHSRKQLQQGMEEALRYDSKALVEAAIPGREIEVSVLGNEKPISSIPGEIIPAGDFYDYRAKYVDDRSELVIPAPLDSSLRAAVQEMAVEVFKAVECFGLARVDFFVDEQRNRILVNEINTMPGFTDISMFPKLWEASGLSFPRLLERLIALAQERWSVEDSRKSS